MGLVVITCEKILFEMSRPHTGVFGRSNSRIYLLPKDAEINVALWIISCRSIGEMMKWWSLCLCCVKTLT